MGCIPSRQAKKECTVYDRYEVGKKVNTMYTRNDLRRYADSKSRCNSTKDSQIIPHNMDIPFLFDSSVKVHLQKYILLHPRVLNHPSLRFHPNLFLFVNYHNNLRLK